MELLTFFLLTSIHSFSDTCSQTRQDDEFWKTKIKLSSLWTGDNFKSKRLPDAIAGSAESHFTTHYTVSTNKLSRCTANSESRVIKHDEILLSGLKDIPGTLRRHPSSALLKIPQACVFAKCHPVQTLRPNYKTFLILRQAKRSAVRGKLIKNAP